MKTTFKSILKESEQTKFLSSEAEIKQWLDSHKVENYSINGDMTVSVNGPFTITDKDIEEIPVKLSEVTGSIDVTGNKLKRIDWAPSKVARDFDCWDNEIETLEGGPEEVEGGFDCDNNKLVNLKGAPKKVGGAFVCSANKLQSLAGCPTFVGKYFKAMGCELTEIDALPASIGTSLYLQNNQLKSFKGVNKLVKHIGLEKDGKIAIGTNPVESGLISLMSINGAKAIAYDSGPKANEVKPALDIINKCLADGSDAFDAQELLMDKNLGNYA